MTKESRPDRKTQSWPAHQIARAFAEKEEELAALRQLQTLQEVQCLRTEDKIREAESALASIKFDLVAAIASTGSPVTFAVARPRNEVSS